MNTPPCQPCDGKGWFFLDTGNDHKSRYEIKRCELCEQFDSDIAAINAVESLAQAYPLLLKFAEKIAGLKHENETDNGDPFERPSEDYIATLNELVLEARQLLGKACQCDACGETVPSIIGCPNGAEVCRDCLETATALPS